MQLFISYSHKDEWARELQRQIEAQLRYKTFIDKRDIFAGVDWWHEICLNIQKCDSLIFIMSPDSVESPYCIEEVKYAIALNKFIIPLILRKCEIPDFISSGRRNYIEVVEASAPHAITQIQNSISIYIERKNEYLPPTLLPPIPPEPSKIKMPSHPDILPNPFKWINISKGIVTLKPNIIFKGKPDAESHRDCVIPEFFISKYPITNGQFKIFVQEDGYKNKKFWTPTGWATKIKKNWDTHPIPNEKLDHPVRGLSWYEAIAFCNWLRHYIPDFEISLPTRGQWQYAAQGDTNKKYPWGNELDKNKCNFDRKRSYPLHTTPVTQYEGIGDSLFGVTDMIGNVLEWGRTTKDGEQAIEIRQSPMRSYFGGYLKIDKNSDNPKTYLNLYNYQSHYPSHKYEGRGFRIVANYHHLQYND